MQDVFWTTLRDEPGHKFPSLRMSGQQVFRWAVFEMSKVAQQALDEAGITPTDLDVFIPHQANMRITDAMIKKIGLAGVGRRGPRHRRDRQHLGGIDPPGDGAHAGSRADASSGDLALLIGFGAGLVYSAQVVVVP